MAAAIAGLLAGCAIAPPSAPPPVRDLTLPLPRPAEPPPRPAEPGAGQAGSSPPSPAASPPERSRVYGPRPASAPPSRAYGPRPTSAPPSRADTAAVAALLEGARVAEEAGQYGRAAASLERALKIEPRNPRLWYRLAAVRYRQGRLAAAESLALRSLSLAPHDPDLDARTRRLVAAARRAREERVGRE